MNIFSFLTAKKEPTNLKEKVTKQVITEAYIKRSQEIESLRKYDRGEKIITPRDLNSFVRSL